MSCSRKDFDAVNGRILTTALLLLAGSAGNTDSASKAAPKQTPMGPVKVTWQGGFNYTASRLRVFGSVHAQAENYDLQAETVTIALASGPRKNAIAGATADGTASKQVSGLFQQVADGAKRVIQVHGDHAVYRPEDDRPGGGRVDFTGHVTMTILDPKALHGPAVAVTEPLTVFLGRNAPGKPPKYPAIEGGGGSLDVTPKP